MKLAIFDVGIRQDSDARYSLNDLHKAAVSSGVTKDIRPNEWMALAQTQGLINELIAENPVVSPIDSKAGRYGGTFACKELIYAYAMWVSPAFHLKVIRAFDALARGDIEEAKRLSQRQVSRNAARLEAPALTDAVRHMRTVQGKDVEHYHFSNEFDLINRITLGMSAKQYRIAHGLGPEGSIRDHLTTLEIKCIEHLQRANATMIDLGMRFDRRKIELHKLYCLRYAGPLACEVQRLEA